jgi:hypothetical protein
MIGDMLESDNPPAWIVRMLHQHTPLYSFNNIIFLTKSHSQISWLKGTLYCKINYYSQSFWMKSMCLMLELLCLLSEMGRARFHMSSCLLLMTNMWWGQLISYIACSGLIYTMYYSFSWIFRMMQPRASSHLLAVDMRFRKSRTAHTRINIKEMHNL